MSKPRPTKLHYMAGISRPHGEYFPGVPMRDLEADDIAALTDEQMADITGTPAGYHGPLYQVTKPAAKTDAPLKKTGAKTSTASGSKRITKPSPAAAPVEPDTVSPHVPESVPNDQTGAAGEQE